MAIPEREGLKNFRPGKGGRQPNEFPRLELHQRSLETSLRNVPLFVPGASFLSALPYLAGELGR